MSVMPNNVNSAGCEPFGIQPSGVAYTACTHCSSKAIDSHDENVCYMKGEKESYGTDETQICHWKCLRCTGPTAGECLECMPEKNLVLQ